MKLPGRRELTLEMGRLERPARRSIYRLVRRGEAASNPREALLAAALARQSLGAWRWAVGAAIVLALLAGVSAVFHIQRDAELLLWMDITVVVLALTNATVMRFRHMPRLRRAEKLNMSILDDVEQSSSGADLVAD
jgi:anti-sigma-K factor RskA